ncbi:MAG: glycosyltransferase [Bacteroidota bacterium]
MSKARKKIFHLVCSNGLGHFKRTNELWFHLRNEIEAEVIIACEKWQFEHFRSHLKDELVSDSNSICFNFLELGGTLKWQERPTQYDWNAYKNRRIVLKNIISKLNLDLVISDNLTSVVDLHPNVLLIGSFLWHDVLENIEEKPEGLKAIISFEKELLRRICPTSVSIQEITMPALKKWTNNKGVSWFIKRTYHRPSKLINSKEKLNVLISTGLSDAGTAGVIDLLYHLNSQLNLRFFSGKATAKKVSKLDNLFIHPFHFSASEFKQIDLMIARPGIGIITEAIEFQIPIIAIDNGNNKEMNFNARQIAALGIGWDAINQSFDIGWFFHSYDSKIKQLKQRPTDGFIQIKEILQKRLNNA